MESGTLLILAGSAAVVVAIPLHVIDDGSGSWWIPVLALGIILIGIGWSFRHRNPT